VSNLTVIHPTARIGSGAVIGNFSVLGANVVIGERVKLGHHVIVYQGSVIGDDVQIGSHSVIGQPPLRDKGELAPARIGDRSRIGAACVLYAGATVGAECLIADQATIREHVTIGNRTVIGRGAAMENDTTIGSFVKIETNVYITAFSSIADHVFIAPCVVTSNDKNAARSPMPVAFKGVTVKRGGRIGAGAVILPGVVIGEEAFVAAGSVVTKDVAKETIVLGCPAKFWKNVPEAQLLKNLPDKMKDRG
jgi:acetyltransferase-like isoleucine patch superfamily enzyme